MALWIPGLCRHGRRVDLGNEPLDGDAGIDDQLLDRHRSSAMRAVASECLRPVQFSTDAGSKNATFDHVRLRRPLDDRLDLGLKRSIIPSHTLFQSDHRSFVEVSITMPSQGYYRRGAAASCFTAK